jgi:hypothetical protein
MRPKLPETPRRILGPVQSEFKLLTGSEGFEPST